MVLLDIFGEDKFPVMIGVEMMAYALGDCLGLPINGK